LARISLMARIPSFFAVRLQASEFLLHTILRRGVDFAFYFYAFAEVKQEADFNAGSFEIIDELGAMGIVKVFDGFQFEDDFVFHNDVGHIVADQLVVVIDLDPFFLLGVEAGFL